PLPSPALPRNLGVHGLPTPPLSSPGQAGREYPGMPRSADPRRRLAAVPSPSFPADAVVHPGDWSSIQEHDSPQPPSSNERALQGPQAVWATPTPSWSARRDSPLPQKVLTPESTNSNEPSDRDARHRSTDLSRTPSTSDSGGDEISVIRHGITTLVCLDKAQVRRYYRLR